MKTTLIKVLLLDPKRKRDPLVNYYKFINYSFFPYWKLIKLESRNRVYECMYDDCRKIFNDKGAYRKHALTHGEKQVYCINLVSLSL